MCLRDLCGFGGQQDRAESELCTGYVKSNSLNLDRALWWGMKPWEAKVCASADLTHSHVCAASPTSARDDAAAEEVTVIINNPISLLCEALPYPSPNITWLKDEVPLKASRNVLLLPGTVLLSPGPA